MQTMKSTSAGLSTMGLIKGYWVTHRFTGMMEEQNLHWASRNNSHTHDAQEPDVKGNAASLPPGSCCPALRQKLPLPLPATEEPQPSATISWCQGTISWSSLPSSKFHRAHLFGGAWVPDGSLAAKGVGAGVYGFPPPSVDSTVEGAGMSVE